MQVAAGKRRKQSAFMRTQKYNRLQRTAPTQNSHLMLHFTWHLTSFAFHFINITNLRITVNSVTEEYDWDTVPVKKSTLPR